MDGNKTYLRRSVNILRRLLSEYQGYESPITYTAVGIVIAGFLMEVIFAVLASVSVRTFATGSFGVHPVIAWIFSPIWHKGVLHFSASIFFLLVFGLPIERHWSRRIYGGFLILSGYLSVASGALVMLIFSNQDVAFYGASGVAYALGAFSLFHLSREHADLTRTEWVAVFFGIVVLVDVIRDPFDGPYFAPKWFNGGHLGGFLVGSIFGWYNWNKCPVVDNSAAEHETPVQTLSRAINSTLYWLERNAPYPSGWRFEKGEYVPQPIIQITANNEWWRSKLHALSQLAGELRWVVRIVAAIALIVAVATGNQPMLIQVILLVLSLALLVMALFRFRVVAIPEPATVTASAQAATANISDGDEE